MYKPEDVTLLLKGVVEIKSSPIPQIQKRPYGYIEFWNPSVEQLKNLIPWLEENRTIAYVWLYGEVESLEDYSSLSDERRITQPFWFAETREEAYSIYTLNRDLMIGDSW